LGSHPAQAAAAIGLVVGAVLAMRPARRRALKTLGAMRVRRSWARATIDSGAAAGPFRCPGVRSVLRVPTGEVLEVRVRRGQSVADRGRTWPLAFGRGKCACQAIGETLRALRC
jgi:hypothetical protein